MSLDTLPDCVLRHVMSYMTLGDMALRLRQVNQRLYLKTTAEMEQRFGRGPRCFLQADNITRVELAMPATVKAITFDAVTNRLYVCTLGDLPNECVLYEHIPVEVPQSNAWVFTEQHKGRLMQRLSLTSAKVVSAEFQGPFLICRSKVDESLIFDCRNRVHLELPMGYTNMFSSKSGRRMAATYERAIAVLLSPLFADVMENEEHSITSSTSYDNYRSRSLTSLPTSPTFSVASDGTAYDDDQPVLLLTSFQTPFVDASRHIITDTFLASVHHEGSSWVLKWANCDLAEATEKLTVTTETLPVVSDIGALQAVREDCCVAIEACMRKIILFNFRTRHLRVIDFMKGTMLRCLSVDVVSSASQQTDSRELCDQTLSCVAMHGNKTQMVLFATDGSVCRKVDSPHTALVACHPTEPMLVAASDEESLPDHPLLQALEGGYGSLIQFDSSMTLKKPRMAKAGGRKDGGADSDRLSLALILCYAAVSLALVWTTFALIYNGWWLYMQKLVFLT